MIFDESLARCHNKAWESVIRNSSADVDFVVVCNAYRVTSPGGDVEIEAHVSFGAVIVWAIRLFAELRMNRKT